MCFLRSKFPSLQWQKKTLRATFTCSLIIIIILENLKISLRNRKMFLQSVHGWLSLLPRRFYESYFLPAPFGEGGGGRGNTTPLKMPVWEGEAAGGSEVKIWVLPTGIDTMTLWLLDSLLSVSSGDGTLRLTFDILRDDLLCIYQYNLLS